MSLNHLTDRQMQLYLDGVISGETPLIEDHLHHCGECRHMIQVYQAVYHEFQSEPGEFFSPAFEDNILTNLKLKTDNKYQSKKNILFAAAIILGIFLPTSYLIMVQFHSYFARVLNHTWSDINSIYFYGLNLFDRLNINIEYLIPAGIIILFYSIFEKILLFSKYKKPFLSNGF